MVQIDTVNLFIKEYVSNIEHIIGMFSRKFGCKDPAKLWRQGIIERTGFLDEKNIEFSFHGSGCTVELENGVIVSFDFLEDGSFTFDLFKFKIFVLSLLPDCEDETEKFFEKIELLKSNGHWTLVFR